MEEVKFTTEELLFIEKIMDIEASYAGDKIYKFSEQHLILRAQGNDKMADLILQQFFEVGETYLITKSIREKIEHFRRRNEDQTGKRSNPKV